MRECHILGREVLRKVAHCARICTEGTPPYERGGTEGELDPGSTEATLHCIRAPHCWRHVVEGAPHVREDNIE